MFKQFLCGLLLLSLTFAITDTEILQQGLNGVYEQNKLADPTTVTACGDPATDHKIVVFIGQSLDKAAKGSLSDLVSLVSDVKNFINSLPQSLTDCLGTNAEVDELAVIYNVKGADAAAIERKVVAYLTLHFLAVHKWAVDLDDAWNAANYYKAGFDAAGYAHSILGMDLVKYIKQIRQRRY